MVIPVLAMAIVAAVVVGAVRLARRTPGSAEDVESDATPASTPAGERSTIQHLDI